MNPIEAAKAILEAEKIGVTEGYPSPKDKGNEAPDSKTAPKATNNAGEHDVNGKGSAAAGSGTDNSAKNRSSVAMKGSDAASGSDQGSEASLAKGVKKRQMKDAGMVGEDEDVEVDIEDILAEDDEDLTDTDEVIEDAEDVEEMAYSDEEEDEEEAKKKKKAKMKEHMDALFNGEDLSEDFRSKAETIFEAAIADRVAELEESYETRLEESVNTIRESLTDKIDDYLSYVVEEWYNENRVALEKGLKAEVAENFIAGLKGLFEDNYIAIPDEKFNLLDETETKVEELTSKLNEQIEKNIELSKSLNEAQEGDVFVEVADGLTDTEVEKFRSLAEGLEYDSVDQYRSKLEVLKENYFKTSVSVNNDTPEENANGEAVRPLSESMSKYTSALDRITVQK